MNAEEGDTKRGGRGRAFLLCGVVSGVKLCGAELTVGEEGYTVPTHCWVAG